MEARKLMGATILECACPGCTNLFEKKYSGQRYCQPKCRILAKTLRRKKAKAMPKKIKMTMHYDGRGRLWAKMARNICPFAAGEIRDQLTGLPGLATQFCPLG